MNVQELPAETTPQNPLDGFVVKDAIAEMEAACSDATPLLNAMRRNERTRRCLWDNQDLETGKKVSTASFEAKPYNGAADHQIFVTQTVMNKRNAVRVMALSEGALTVNPTESTDAAAAANMKTVMRYYLRGPMRNEVLTQGLRAGSFADRYRFSLLYVGWKEERGLDPVEITTEKLVDIWLQQQAAQMAQTSDGMTELAQNPEDVIIQVLDPANEQSLVDLVLQAYPSLALRGKEGQKQARKAVNELQKGSQKAIAHGAFIKRSSPIWEALEPFVDVILPVASFMEDGLDSCRWIGRVKWRSKQWINEQAAIHGWDDKWVKKVLKDCQGKSRAFTNRLGSAWALSGSTVNLTSNTKSTAEERHLYQIIELWDKTTTSDGLTCTYQTVMHADVPDMVAKRELRADWDGMYPFVPFTFSMDEKLISNGLSVPEVCKTAQHAMKAQADSRTDAAALTTYPIWTGDPELAGIRISPGKFIPSRMGKVPEAFKINPPDGRSIEIEKSLKSYVDEFFGFPGNTVPDSIAMSMMQADVAWFMAGISQAVARSGRLIQQYMPPLKGARITGTTEVVNATSEDVRGQFDFIASFNVKSMNVEWVKEHLGMIKDFVMPLDTRGDINNLPALEVAFNLIDPNLAARSLPATAESKTRKTTEAARRDIAEIFTGSPLPQIHEGMDFGGIAEAAVLEVQSSPARMNAVIGGQQTHAVLTAYISGLVNNTKQHGGQNARTGRTLQEDPLKPKSKPEEFLTLLESLPEGASLAQWQAYQQQNPTATADIQP